MKTLHETKQVQQMLQSQERIMDGNKELIRRKQSEMLQKHKEKADKKSTETKK